MYIKWIHTLFVYRNKCISMSWHRCPSLMRVLSREVPTCLPLDWFNIAIADSKVRQKYLVDNSWHGAQRSKLLNHHDRWIEMIERCAHAVLLNVFHTYTYSMTYTHTILRCSWYACQFVTRTGTFYRVHSHLARWRNQKMECTLTILCWPWLQPSVPLPFFPSFGRYHHPAVWKYFFWTDVWKTRSRYMQIARILYSAIPCVR